MGILYIFWVRILSGYIYCKHLLPACDLPFSSLDGIFWATKVASFIFNLSNFPLQLVLFVLCLRNFCPCKMIHRKVQTWRQWDGNPKVGDLGGFHCPCAWAHHTSLILSKGDLCFYEMTGRESILYLRRTAENQYWNLGGTFMILQVITDASLLPTGLCIIMKS